VITVPPPVRYHIQSVLANENATIGADQHRANKTPYALRFMAVIVEQDLATESSTFSYLRSGSIVAVARTIIEQQHHIHIQLLVIKCGV
jgi:hypothetical protein